jgi:CelD/BcsL family acetyltransferase involved in cellulose biosynthesis
MQAMRVETRDSVGELTAEWDELADRVGAQPWLRPGWIAAWWKAFGAGRLSIITLIKGDRLAGVLPIMEERGVIRSTSNWHTPEFGLLADRDELDELAGALVQRRPRRVWLAFVDAGEQGIAACRAAAQKAGYRTLERTLERSPYVRIEGDWEAYRDSLGKKLASELRRRRRRLEEEGRFTFEVVDGRDGLLLGLLDEGFAVEAAGWKSERNSAISSRPETLGFYRTVARWAAERGWLRLAFLRLDGRPFAFDFGIEDGGIHYLLKTGFDPAFAKFAPGMILRYEMLARAFSTGVHSYEFLGSDEPWKLEWTKTTRERTLFQAFAPSVRGRVEWAAFAWGRPAATRLLAVAGR